MSFIQFWIIFVDTLCELWYKLCIIFTLMFMNVITRDDFHLYYYSTFNVLLGAHAIKAHSQQQSPGKLCTNTRSKPFCWTKPACFNFASSNCNSQGHILSTRGVALTELKRPSFQFTNQPKIINVKKQVIFAVFYCQILKLKIIEFSYHFAEGSQRYRRIFRFIN